ncbi:MAG: tetratricopeptide repeat protein, partial [Tsuneonella sp.]
MTTRTGRALLSVLALAMGAGALPAAAQDSNTELRLKKAEAEIRALQRKVFPGGDGTYFEPQISTAQPARTGVTTPSTTAVTDMLARLDALESQLARLTSQTEENTNAIGKLNTRLAALEVTSGAAAAEAAKPGTAADVNVAAMTGGASIKPAPPPTSTASKPADPKPAGPTA